MNILVVAAHADDEVLGVGGTILRHIQEGNRVTVAILSEGITSRRATRDEVGMEELERLKNDARQAAEILGSPEIRFFDLPDNRFDGLDLLDIVKPIESLIEEIQPELVYTHFFGDLNIDHVLTARAVLTACRPLPEASVRRILAFEVPSATGWGFPNQPFVPTVFVDVSLTLPAKLKAMEAYRSEIRPYPHPRAVRAIDERARTWGTQVGMAAAEPFVLIRELVP
ncbi:MAG: hypothetical protein A2X84_14310 [Desulfuromonadaceae bacterium GWC2_58_13]|nr:MAG: hypothetical protein A2X84_14310 [Desulfuromonadaceae bacterium GWC2_58_13]